MISFFVVANKVYSMHIYHIYTCTFIQSPVNGYLVCVNSLAIGNGAVKTWIRNCLCRKTIMILLETKTRSKMAILYGSLQKED